MTQLTCMCTGKYDEQSKYSYKPSIPPWGKLVTTNLNLINELTHGRPYDRSKEIMLIFTLLLHFSFSFDSFYKAQLSLPISNGLYRNV